MSVDDLRHEFREYTLRIEEVLAGMDRALTELDKRMTALEGRMESAALSKPDSATSEHLRSLDEQIATMGAVLSDLMGERK